MNRREFLAALGAGATAMFLPSPAWPAERKRPNLLVVVADDLGYADLGVQGCRDVPTPNIDSIARNGIRFTNGYVSCPVCSPTRAGLQTGRYQQRFGHEFNPGPAETASPTFGLPLTEVTIADRLKAAGYATGLVGKWHLGYRPEFHPMRRGYDEFFGFLGGSHSYLGNAATMRQPILRGTTPVDEKEYLTDAFGREAAAFIERHRDEPFFLMVTFNAVHNPTQATTKYLDRFAAITDPLRKTLAARLSAMDDATGAILQKLRDAGVYDDTLIFFVSDNGGPTDKNGSRNDPLSGFKGEVREGGIRVPFLMQWKAQLPSGRVYDQPVIALDIHPTCLAAAGNPFDSVRGRLRIPPDKPLDGVNLLPYVRGDKGEAPHEYLYWRFGRQLAVRRGRYKLVRMGAPAPRDREQLFDLATDHGERNDLSTQKADVARELAAALGKWNAELKPPAWGGSPRQRAAGA
jgi:arylsulfatase A-like enzyme